MNITYKSLFPKQIATQIPHRGPVSLDFFPSAMLYTHAHPIWSNYAFSLHQFGELTVSYLKHMTMKDDHKLSAWMGK